MKADQQTLKAIRALVKGADVVEGLACPGTKLEATTFGVGKKVTSAKDERLQVGANGWAKLSFEAGKPPAKSVLMKWIAQSRTAVVGAPPR